MELHPDIAFHDLPVPGSAGERNGARIVPVEGFDSQGGGMFNFVLILVARKNLILAMTLLGAMIATAFALRIKDTYTATAVIMQPQQQRSAIQSLVGQLGPAGTALGGADVLKTPSDLYMSLLGSRTIADRLIAQFDLQQIYESKNLTMARRGLAGRTSFTSGKDFLIRIAVDDSDPQRAAGIANAYVDQLHQLNSQLALTESAQRRLFFEQRLEEETKTLAAAEASMKAIQERTGLLQVSSQLDAVVRSIAQLRAEITSREVMLETWKAGATERNPEVVRMHIEIASLRDQLRKAEAGAGPGTQAGIRNGLMLGAEGAPAASLAYLRGLREFQYHESLFESLGKQYEAAKLDEAKDAPLVQVVDPAIPPEETKPKRRLWIVLFGACSFGILGAVMALCWHAFRDPENAPKIHEIRGALRPGRAGAH